MATHSSILAWRIPGTREPGGLPSMGLHEVGHDWSDLAAAAFLSECAQFKKMLMHFDLDISHLGIYPEDKCPTIQKYTHNSLQHCLNCKILEIT